MTQTLMIIYKIINKLILQDIMNVLGYKYTFVAVFLGFAKTKKQSSKFLVNKHTHPTNTELTIQRQNV